MDQMAQDGAMDMGMPRKAFSVVYDLVLDRGEGDNQHLAKVASLLFGDDAEVCPLGYAPHGARFLVDALSSPRRDAFASAVGEKLWEHITKLNDDDDLQTAARLLRRARPSTPRRHRLHYSRTDYVRKTTMRMKTNSMRH